MIDAKFSTILRTAIVPQVIDEETKMWHFSPLTIFNIWKEEKETGKVVFPEEGLL